MPHLRHVGLRGEAVLRIISAAFPRFFFGGRPVKDGWFPQEIAMKFHHIYNYLCIYIYIHYYIHLYKIYPSRSLKLPHVDDVASKDVDEELATFYVFRDDIVMFPISYSIPKDQWVHSSAKDMASMLSLDEIMRETHMIVYGVCSQTYGLFLTSRSKVYLFDCDSTPCFTVTHNPWFTCYIHIVFVFVCVCVCLFVSFLCYRIVIQDDHWNPKSFLCRRTGSCGRSLRRRSLPSGPVMIMGGEPARV